MICVLYEAFHQDDHGRAYNPIGIFANRFEAEEAAKGKGAYGSEGIVSEVIALRVDGQHYRLAERDPLKVEG